MWIDDFTVAQAHEFFDRHQFLLLNTESIANTVDVNAQLRMRLFDTIGTRPVDLEKAISTLGATSATDESVDRFVGEALLDARDVLVTLFKRTDKPTGDEFKVCVRALLALGDDPSVGVLKESFDGALGVARLVAQALKLDHALLYLFSDENLSLLFASILSRCVAHEERRHSVNFSEIYKRNAYNNLEYYLV